MENEDYNCCNSLLFSDVIKEIAGVLDGIEILKTFGVISYNTVFFIFYKPTEMKSTISFYHVRGFTSTYFWSTVLHWCHPTTKLLTHMWTLSSSLILPRICHLAVPSSWLNNQKQFTDQRRERESYATSALLRMPRK